MAIRWCILFVSLLAAQMAYADGCAWGKGFTTQLRETHQLAVINLTESTADVNMFIAIDGIPAGKELTYVLPFWHKPEGFTLTEDDANAFRRDHVAQAHDLVMENQHLLSRKASNTFGSAAGMIAAGPGFLLFVPNVMGASTKGRLSGVLAPYETHEIPSARAELYKIGDQDLQQLLRQAGLPAKYAEPLKKYHTPYFAVMRLTGLPKQNTEKAQFSGRGVRYHFTHHLTDSHYTYPLGTGAAWPQPIPITEIYITCPERLALDVKAPIEGKLISPSEMERQVYKEARLREMTPEEGREYLKSDPELEQQLKEPSPKTASLLGAGTGRPFAWHIAYTHSNPDEDISVAISTRPHPWRLAITHFIDTYADVPWIYCLLISALSWLIVIQRLIRKRWEQSDDEDSLWIHVGKVFIKAQVLSMLSAAFIFVTLFSGYLPELMTPAGWQNLSNWMPLLLLLLCIGCVGTVLTLRARKMHGDWRQWLTVTSWFYATLIYAIGVAPIYGLLYWCETL